MKSKIGLVLTAILLSSCSLFGIRSGYEQPGYTVLEQQGDGIELRRYAPGVAAEATVAAADGAAGQDAAFRLLFQYISGKNRAAARIDMTAPVEVAQAGKSIAMTAPVETARTADGGTRMRFFLPAAYSADTAPQPLDARLRIVATPERTVAVLRFTGLGGESTVAEKTQELLRQIEGTPWRPTSPPVAYFYDPPWTIPFFRRNEVAVAVTR